MLFHVFHMLFSQFPFVPCVHSQILPYALPNVLHVIPLSSHVYPMLFPIVSNLIPYSLLKVWPGWTSTCVGTFTSKVRPPRAHKKPQNC
jgi:hypothetical protein